MKKVFILMLVFVMVFSFVAFKAPKAYAQGFGVSWDSSFQVLNLSTTDTANIDIYFYNQDGSLATMEATYNNPEHDTVLLGQSNTYFPMHVAAGFNGSVVVSSDQPIAVISNLVVNTSAKGLGSYVAFQAGAPKLYFPLVMKGNANQTTTFNVQNTTTGTSAVNITIVFTPEAGSAYATIPNITDSIPAGAAHTYDLSARPEFTAISKWVGSVTVNVANATTDSVAGVATTVSQKYTDAYQLATYNGFTKGTTSVILPLIQENNNGNRTSINCQNLDTVKTVTLTATYTPEAGSVAKPPESKPSIPPLGTAVFLQSYTGTAKFVGAATVTSDQSVNLVCVVNQQKPSRGTYSAYEGFDPASATNKVVLPLVQSKNGSAANGYVFSSINLAVANGSKQDVVCTFQPAPGFGTPANQTGNGAAVVFLQTDLFGNGTKFVGGATCTVSTGGLFAIVNQARQNTPQLYRDTLSSYDGFNQ